MKISLGTDHAGYLYKEAIKKMLTEAGHTVHDFGTFSTDPVDYPDFIRPAALAVAKGEFERGIVLGGSGNGEAMTANRIIGVRCALCWNLETAELGRKHNDSNVLSLGADGQRGPRAGHRAQVARNSLRGRPTRGTTVENGSPGVNGSSRLSRIQHAFVDLVPASACPLDGNRLARRLAALAAASTRRSRRNGTRSTCRKLGSRFGLRDDLDTASRKDVSGLWDRIVQFVAVGHPNGSAIGHANRLRNCAGV